MQAFHLPQAIFPPLIAEAGRPGSRGRQALVQLCALYRVQTLAALVSAGHGWLGASFSCLDLLAVIYHRLLGDPRLPPTARPAVILSKGHGVMAQYAILEGLGVLTDGAVLTYQRVNGLPAHCDSEVPGVDADSGSLGQGLSKGIGLAVARDRSGCPWPVYVVLGDGELQEGQVFESLLTLKQWNLRHCVAIIDRNSLQSDSQTSAIKDADDWPRLLRGIGLRVVEVDGHDLPALERVLRAAPRAAKPTVVLAKTAKGHGCSLSAMSPLTPRRQGIWHGRVPDPDEYRSHSSTLLGGH